MHALADLQKDFPISLPAEYTQFLSAGALPRNLQIEPVDYSLFPLARLFEPFEVKGPGIEPTYRAMRLFNQLARAENLIPAFAIHDKIQISFERIDGVLTIGSDYDGNLLYLDPADSWSVWVFYFDGGDVHRLANSFSSFLALGKPF